MAETGFGAEYKESKLSMKEKVLILCTPVLTTCSSSDGQEEEESKEMAASSEQASQQQQTSRQPRRRIRPQEFQAVSFCRLGSLQAPCPRTFEKVHYYIGAYLNEKAYPPLGSLRALSSLILRMPLENVEEHLSTLLDLSYLAADEDLIEALEQAKEKSGAKTREMEAKAPEALEAALAGSRLKELDKMLNKFRTKDKKPSKDMLSTRKRSIKAQQKLAKVLAGYMEGNKPKTIAKQANVPISLVYNIKHQIKKSMASCQKAGTDQALEVVQPRSSG
jgi:hypothetical protein